MISDYIDKKNISLYQPPSEVLELTKVAKENYQRGYEIVNQSFPELNDKSVIQDEQSGKKLFNAYVNENVDDPAEAWKWKGTRSAARNAAVAMHAQLTAGYLFPSVSAQDENDTEDRAVGNFMREMLVWLGENSNYKSSFIQVVMGMLTNPVTYLGAEFVEVMQKIKEKTAKGYETKEVLDEELSGFRAPVYSSQDVLITNAYVQNIQQQTCVIKQRYLDYADAEKKYGRHENWSFVKRGTNTIFNETENMFYDVRDMENPDLVKETIFMWRSEDLEVPFLGGIYMGDENTEYNPMTHRDVKKQPKYDIVPFGYHRISEHFFYYKSLMSALQWDDALLDEMYRVVMNREFLDLIPPVWVSGEEKVDTQIIFPGAQHVTTSKDSKATAILPPAQGNQYAALANIEKSIREGSISEVIMGQLPTEASQKATAIVQASQSAKTLLKGVGKSLGESIVQYGKLMVDIVVNHLSIPQVREIAGGDFETKYGQYVLPNQNSKGRAIGKILRFDGDLVGRKMTEGEKEDYAVKLAEETGYPDEKSSIIVMNPEMATRMKYLISFDPEEIFENNQYQTQMLLQNLYAQMRQDPLVDAEVLVREYLYAFFKSKGEDFINKNPQPVGVSADEVKMPTPMPQTPEMAIR